MKDEQFTLHARIEDSHWWFVARRRIVAKVVKRVLPANSRFTVVDVGCGTGANIGAFADSHDCWGLDISETAIELARRRFPAVQFNVGSVSDASTFAILSKADCVLVLDVLEHVADDFEFASELLRAMKPGAFLIITVPADLSLWSPHDVYLDHYRRYDVQRLQKLWSGLPVTCRLLSHFNSRLHPLIKATRFVNRLRGSTVGRCGTDLFQLPRWIASVPCGIMANESHRLVKALDGDVSRNYHRGVSLMAVLQRNEGDIRVRRRPRGTTEDINPALTLADAARYVSAREASSIQNTIVIPCYNESNRLRVDDFVAFVDENPNWNLLFVDDGSTDDTWEILQALVDREGSQMQAIRLAFNSGKAEAVRRGIAAAIASHSAVVGYWDADLATPLNEVERLAAVLDADPACEIVLGARVKLLGRRIQRTRHRHILGRLFATAASFALKLPVYDTQCGAKLFRVTPAIRYAFESPFVSRWIFDVEVIGRYLAANPRKPNRPNAIVEVPLLQWADVHGSKLTCRSFMKAGFDLFRAWNYLRKLRSLHLHDAQTFEPRPDPSVMVSQCELSAGELVSLNAGEDLGGFQP